MAATGGRGKEETFSLSGAWRRLEQEVEAPGSSGRRGRAGGGHRIGRAY